MIAALSQKDEEILGHRSSIFGSVVYHFQVRYLRYPFLQDATILHKIHNIAIILCRSLEVWTGCMSWASSSEMRALT